MLLAAACSGVPSEEAAGPDRVRVAVVPYLTNMPFYVAADEGYFERHGLDVEFIHLGRNQELMTALARGDVDASGGMLTVNELALAATGARVRMVASMGELVPGECTLGGFVALREHAESGALEDPERLSQLTLDTDVMVPFGWWTDLLLEPLDMTTDDVEMINLPSTASVPALIEGNLDLGIEMEPFYSGLIASGEVVLWRSLEELVPGYPVTLLMYGASLLDDRPEVGERFAMAMLEAVRQYRKGKTPRNLEIIEAASRLSAEQVASACWPYMSPDGRMDTSFFREYQEWNVARGLVDRVLEDDELFDHRFIERANAELVE
jgi:NitT/TauT family transport system substrate-binding protein